MLTLLLAAALAVAPRPSHPATSPVPVHLSGIVTDTAGTRLADVRVHILELGRGTTTGPDGKFVLAELPSGTYGVAFSRIGYAPLVRRVTIDADDTTLAISMRPTIVELPEVQVTATPTATTALTSPQPTSILDQASLRVAQAPSLGETISSLAGVHSISEGPAIGKPVIRGLSSNRVLVLDNGQRIETQGWGDEHSPNIETADAERIEVIRGPASVLYGSDALGGVVNVVKRDLPDAIGRDPTLGGSLSAAYSTNNEQPDGTAQIEGATGGLGFRASLTGRTSSDFGTPLGEVFNTGNRAVSGDGSVGYRGSWGSLRSDFTYRDEKPELHDDATATPFQRIGDTRAGLTANLPIGLSRLEVITGFERNRRREFDEAGADDVASGLLANSYKADVRFHHPPVGKVSGLVGVQTLFDDFTISGVGQHLIPSNQARNVGVYGFEQVDLERWTFSFGARYDARDLDVSADPPPPIGTGTPAQTRTYNSVVGNVGALFHVSEPVALVLNVGRGYRAPQPIELFANGVHEGTIEYDVGNPDLENETSVNADLALRVQSGRVSLELGGFADYINNYIYFRPTGTFDSPSGGLEQPCSDPEHFSCFQKFQAVQGDARLTGFEFSAEYHPTPYLHLSGTADYTRGQNRSTDQPLPLVPPFRATYSARFEAAGNRVFVKPYISVGGETDARQTELDPDDFAPAGYTLANAGAGVALATGSRLVQLDVSLKNAFDSRYQSFLSRYKFSTDPLVLDAGRNLRVRVGTDF
ncbi:MAG: TonB-dependent receptor [Gemmatimonadales bacterium]